MSVLIVFGSDSDKPIYDKIREYLQQKAIPCEAVVCSAHRTPDMLQELLRTKKFDVVVAGAGLAAHLPGVIAAKTLKPVIGVPVKSNFEGLDSLLSIMQMPPGVPVLSVGVDAAQEAARHAELVLRAYQSVTLVGAVENPRVKACADVLTEFGVPFTLGKRTSPDTITINFMTKYEFVESPDLVINVLLKEQHPAQDAVGLLSQTAHGLWVGINRAENAAIAAIEILNRDGKYQEKLEAYRHKLKQKITREYYNKPLLYKDAGVNIDTSNDAVERIGKHVKSTFNEHVLGDVGSFGGLFRLAKEYKDPVLVSSTDGVGTKLKLAFKTGIHNTIGQDLVNHCVNDILVQGAKPLFFLDYVGNGKLDPGVFEQVVAGMAFACKENGCVLIGGETAQLPGLYQPGEYDLAGFIVGVVEREHVVTGEHIRVGDVLLAIHSNGLQTNGYSLAMLALLEKAGLPLTQPLPELEGKSVAQALMAIHPSYLKPVWPVLTSPLGTAIHGMAHITGGGFYENIPRILPQGCQALVDAKTWDPLLIFKLIQKAGEVERREMYRTFNMGVGFILVVEPSRAEEVQREINKVMKCTMIGKICSGNNEEVIMEW